MKRRLKEQVNEHAPILRTTMVVLSIVLSLCALGFTCYQTRLSRNAVTAQLWQNLTQPGNDITRLFIDHPNLRPYFYKAKPIDQSDPNFDAVMAVSEMYLDFIESFSDDYVLFLPGMAENGESRLLWDRYFKDLFTSSPALCAYAKEKQHWYSTDFTVYAPTENSSMQLGSSNEALEGYGSQAH